MHLQTKEILMQKLLVCLLVAQSGALQAMQQKASNHPVMLPNAARVRQEIGRSIFEDFFTQTCVVSDLAGQKKSYDETLEILKTCAAAYFKKKDQPVGRNYFYTQVDEIAQRLVSWQEHPAKPQHTCKLHTNVTTHEHLNPSPNSKINDQSGTLYAPAIPFSEKHASQFHSVLNEQLLISATSKPYSNSKL